MSLTNPFLVLAIFEVLTIAGFFTAATLVLTISSSSRGQQPLNVFLGSFSKKKSVWRWDLAFVLGILGAWMALGLPTHEGRPYYGFTYLLGVLAYLVVGFPLYLWATKPRAKKGKSKGTGGLQLKVAK